MRQLWTCLALVALVDLSAMAADTVSLAGGQASCLSWPTGFQPVVSLEDRQDPLSAVTFHSSEPLMTPQIHFTSLRIRAAGEFYLKRKMEPVVVPFLTTDFTD